jgi:hypothetical protein
VVGSAHGRMAKHNVHPEWGSCVLSCN